MTYPHKPIYPHFKYVHPEKSPNDGRNHLAVKYAFMPLDWVSPSERNTLKQACDCLYLWISVFQPNLMLTEEDMAKQQNPREFDYTFATVRLSEEDVESFHVWAGREESHIWNFLTKLMEDGYKMSLSPDLENSCIICTLTATKHASDNQKMCLSSRSDNGVEAVLLAIYKHYVMSEGKTWQTGPTRQNWG